MATKPRYLKTPIQLWVGDNRRDLGLTSADLAALTGVTEDTARGWESRGRPSEDALLILQRRFGKPIPDERSDVAADQAALVTALDRQSKAIETAVALVSPIVQAQARRLDKMEAVLEGLVRQAIPDGDGRPSPMAQTER